MPRDAPADSAILYLHGGAWILGWYDSHRRMLGHICLAAGMRAFAADYRLAPEHPFPAALRDCVAAYRQLLDSGLSHERIALAGDSAGGNLVLSTLMALRDAGDRLPAAAVCLSPMTDLACTGDSFRSDGDALLSAAFARENAARYYGSNDPTHPLISPLYGDLSGLPPLLIQAGSDEILLSDAERLHAKAMAEGVDSSLRIWQGMWHVWQIYVPWMTEAREAVAEIGGFLRERIPQRRSPS